MVQSLTNANIQASSIATVIANVVPSVPNPAISVNALIVTDLLAAIPTVVTASGSITTTLTAGLSGPAGTVFASVSVRNDTAGSGADFVVAGTIYRDDMGSDVGLGGVTVMLKITMPGQADPVIRIVTTNSRGEFEARGLARGTVQVSVVLPDDLQLSEPLRNNARTVSLTEGQPIATGVNFAAIKKALRNKAPAKPGNTGAGAARGPLGLPAALQQLTDPAEPISAVTGADLAQRPRWGQSDGGAGSWQWPMSCRCWVRAGAAGIFAARASGRAAPEVIRWLQGRLSSAPRSDTQCD